MEAGSAPRPDVFAVVLAAGGSRRFGTPKLLEKFAGETLVARAAGLARSVCAHRSVLVTGHLASEVVAAAGGRCAVTLENTDYRAGLGSSIALAARELAGRADALLLLLADQPLIDVQHLGRLVATWSGRDDEIVATAFAQTTGPPVLMPAGTFPALEQLAGEPGARSLFTDPRFSLRAIRFEQAAVDIDTSADLERLRSEGY